MKSKYFSHEELTHSATADAHNVRNVPNERQAECLEALMVDCLDPIRELWRERLIVNSGYRCPRLNALVGGVKNSQHMRGEAADITTNSRTNNALLFKKVANSDIDFDQLILEAGANWLHVSYKRSGNRRQILDRR